MVNYETQYPSMVTLYDDNQQYPLNFNDNQNRVLILETTTLLPTLKSVFVKEGFTETTVEGKQINQISQGLFKRLTPDWDMHVRFLQIHEGSIAIDAEVETSREFIEHVNGKWISVIYEVTNIFNKYGLQFGIWHKGAQRHVRQILQNGKLMLDDISGKIEWKPLAVGALVGIGLGLILKKLLDED